MEFNLRCFVIRPIRYWTLLGSERLTCHWQQKWKNILLSSFFQMNLGELNVAEAKSNPSTSNGVGKQTPRVTDF